LSGGLSICRLLLSWSYFFCREGFLLLVSPWGYFFLPWGYSFHREVISFCRESFTFALRLFFLPWSYFFCREVILFDQTEVKRISAKSRSVTKNGLWLKLSIWWTLTIQNGGLTTQHDTEKRRESFLIWLIFDRNFNLQTGKNFNFI